MYSTEYKKKVATAALEDLNKGLTVHEIGKNSPHDPDTIKTYIYTFYPEESEKHNIVPRVRKSFNHPPLRRQHLHHKVKKVPQLITVNLEGNSKPKYKSNDKILVSLLNTCEQTIKTIKDIIENE